MQLTDLKIQISCHKDFLVSFFITPSFFYLNDFVLTFTFTDDSAIRYPVSGSLLLFFSFQLYNKILPV
jgi:hypothetical protein